MSITIFLLTLGAAARLTRLVTDDYITRHFRAFFIRRYGPDNDLAYLVTCPWCMSMYISGGMFTLAWFYGWHPAFIIATAALTASYLIGTAATLFGSAEVD
uniref:DUF1360 domain-containing protein n=1 Tax=Rhodococcus qingshengii TaxID=334542 RepID=UPI001C4DF79D|nr:DUF1360 domain-containing protein [Rhodococcus qingshengii]